MARVVRKSGAAARQVEFLRTMGSAYAKVGWLKTAKYPDGTPAAYIAVIHENGCPEQNIPPRPFFGPTAADSQAGWEALAERGATAIAAGQMTPIDMLTVIAETAKTDVQQSIDNVRSPALAESTIRARESKRVRQPNLYSGDAEKPLRDTGFLQDSLQVEVGEGNAGGED